MTGDLWLETPCEHGYTKRHKMGWRRAADILRDDYVDPGEFCDRGSRRRVRIDYEAAYERYKTVTPSELTSVEMEFVRELVDAALVTEIPKEEK